MFDVTYWNGVGTPEDGLEVAESHERLGVPNAT